MKRKGSFLLAAVLLCTLIFGTAARAADDSQPTLPDDGHIETTLITGVLPPDDPTGMIDEEYHDESTQPNTTTKTLLHRYYDAAGNLDWMVALTATFRYTGLSARCTAVKKTCRIYDNAWRLTASDVTKDANHAAASFTLACVVTGVAVKTVDTALNLYCDRSGAVSGEPLPAGWSFSFLTRWLDAVRLLLRRLFIR